MAYQNTQAPIARSQEAIRKLLIKFNARGVQFYEDFKDGDVNIRFAKELNGTLRTVSVSMKVPELPAPKRKRRSYVRYQRGKLRSVRMSNEETRREQATKATYRALHYWLKAQFEAVEFGLMTFEDVFLSHFEWMMEDGHVATIGKIVLPALMGQTSNLLPESIDGIVDE